MELAIEFDGLYWHSTEILSEKHKVVNFKKYHLDKTEKCEKAGIQLIHIFENEWRFNRSVVESRIKNLLGLYDKTIFARKCEIREIDSNMSKLFQK